MPEAKIAQKAPCKVNLEVGKKYYWCTCGESANQPFCDGTHKNEGNFKSQHFEVSEAKDYWLCACKRTTTPPFCDGSHKNC